MAKPKQPKAAIDSQAKQMADIRAQIHYSSGALHFTLEMFGDHIARREGYKAHDGLDAVRFYIINKHGWLPRDVIAMNLDELRFLLEEEMHGWTLPVEARKSYPNSGEKD